MNRRKFLHSVTAGGIILAAPAIVDSTGLYRGAAAAYRPMGKMIAVNYVAGVTSWMTWQLEADGTATAIDEGRAVYDVFPYAKLRHKDAARPPVAVMEALAHCAPIGPHGVCGIINVTDGPPGSPVRFI